MAINRVDYAKFPVRARDDWYVGMDVGQKRDPSALSALNHVVRAGEWQCDDARRIWKQDKTERFLVRHLERLPLGMPYPAQIEHVAGILAREPLKGATFGLDFTGVGRPIFDLFLRGGVRPQGIQFTSGNDIRSDGQIHYVPKQYLVANLEARLHSNELRFAPDLADAPALRAELQSFNRKISETGYISYNAKVGAFDDQIMAVCIALFLATNRHEITSTELRI